MVFVLYLYGAIRLTFLKRGWSRQERSWGGGGAASSWREKDSK